MVFTVQLISYSSLVSIIYRYSSHLIVHLLSHRPFHIHLIVHIIIYLIVHLIVYLSTAYYLSYCPP